MKMMEQKLDTFEELMLELLAGNLSQEGEQKLTHFLESDISYQQQYKEMARTRAKALVGKFEQEKQANYDILAAKLGLKKEIGKKETIVVAHFLTRGCHCFVGSCCFHYWILYI